MEPMLSADGASKILTWNPERFIYTDRQGITVSLGVHRSGALAIDLYGTAFLCPEAIEWATSPSTAGDTVPVVWEDEVPTVDASAPGGSLSLPADWRPDVPSPAEPEVIIVEDPAT